MTKEEAIETIKYILKVIPKEPPTECDNIEEWLCEDDEIRKALDIAIKSLEQTIDKEKMIEELEESLQKANATLVDGKQKSYEDAVSRKAILNTLNRMDSVLDENRTVETYKELLTACYKDLPPVTPTKCIATVKFSKEDMRELIDEKMKEIVVERKKGHWINKSQKSGCGIKFVASECTCCGKKTFFDCDQLVYNYCPNCGAKMGGE